MSVGDRLRDARKARDLTQPELAKMAGVSQTTVSDLERERNVSSKSLPLIAACLGVSALWLSTGKGSREGAAFTRPVDPERQIDTELMINAYHAAAAFNQQTGAKLDDDGILLLACRIYEQHIGQPNKSADEMLGYLVSVQSIIRDGENP